MKTMDPKRWKRIRTLFEEACEKNPAEQAAFLERECASDPQMGRELEDFLAAENAKGFFAIASNAFDLLAGDSAESPPLVFQTGEILAGGFQIVPSSAAAAWARSTKQRIEY